jgi:membrane-associated HD superfamily phosphohydrolase
MVIPVLIVVLAVVLFSLYCTSNKSDKRTEDWKYVIFSVVFIAFVILIWISSFTVGQENGELKHKYPIKPTIEVHCVNGKCDTTYIYRTPKTK